MFMVEEYVGTRTLRKLIRCASSVPCLLQLLGLQQPILVEQSESTGRWGNKHMTLQPHQGSSQNN